MKMALLKLFFMSDFWLRIINLKKLKALKEELNEKLMLVAWHPQRLSDLRFSEDERKETEVIFKEN